MVKNKDDDDEDKQMRKNTGRREEWDQWSVDYLDRVDGKGSDEASWAQRFLGTDVTIGLSAAQQRKRIQDNREAVSDLIRHQEPEDLKQVIRDAAKNRAAPLRSNARLAWQALQASCQIPMTVLQLQAKTKEVLYCEGLYSRECLWRVPVCCLRCSSGVSWPSLCAWSSWWS